MNDASSRSHAIFSIVIESEVLRDGKLFFCRGKLNIVDLAGSERIYKSRNSQGMIKEACSINLSLHYLEQVIISLKDAREQQDARPVQSKGGKSKGRRRHSFTNLQQLKGGTPKSKTDDPSTPQIAVAIKHRESLQASSSKTHIPYRNSVLTNILRDSLGGNCRTCFLLTASWDSVHFGESVATCR